MRKRNLSFGKMVGALLLAGGALSLSAQVEKISGAEIESSKKLLPEAAKSAASDTLKQYISSLDPAKAPRAAVNALRVANELKNSKAPADSLAYYVVPAMSEIPRLPDVYPVDGKLGGEMRIVLAKDEFEPASFVLFPFKNIDKVDLKVSALTGPNGAVLPNADLKVVKVWYQNGNGWFSYFADPGLVLVPELLLNDENLIRVDTKDKANYARVDYPSGSKEVWISAPKSLDTGFRAIEEPFADAKTLQPVALKAGEFKQFFLTVNAPKKAAEGVYKGMVEVSAGGKKLADIPVAVRVLPFELPLPKTFYDVKKDFVVSLMGDFSWHGLMSRNGGDRALAEQQQVALLKNLRNHSLFHPSISPEEQDGRTFKIFKDLDIPTKPFWGKNFLPWFAKNFGGRLSFDEMMIAKSAAKKCSEFYKKELGHNDIFLTYSDEPGAAYVVMIRDFFKYYHEYGMKFGTAGHSSLLYKAGYTYGIHPFGGFPNEVDRINPWNIIGDKYVGFYAGQHNGSENPQFVRRQHGMLSYLSNCSMIDNYEFAFGPYNDRVSDTYKPMVLAYMSRGGLIDTLGWEGFREGIDDMRYASKLMQLTEEAIASGNTARMLEAKKARQYMALLDGTRIDLNEVRAEMINYILKLSSMR